MSFVLECLLGCRLIDLNDENEKSYHHISSTQSTQDCAVRSAPHINGLSVKNAVLSSNFRNKTALINFSSGHLGVFRLNFIKPSWLVRHQLPFSHTLLINVSSVEQTYAAQSPAAPDALTCRRCESVPQVLVAGLGMEAMFQVPPHHQ